NTLSPESAMRELKTVLSIAVSGPGAAYAALKAGAGRVYLHLEGIAGQKRPDINEIGQIIEEGRLKGCEIVLALPRIQKPADISYQDYLDMQPESVLAGNIGSLHNCLQQGLKVRSDYSLNIFNRAALRSLLNQGVEGICLSPELNFRQLQSFNNLDKVELLVHGEIILMTSEFCILKGILGSNEGKCPAYCRQDSYYLQDDKGYKFPLAADNSCRLYLFNSRTLCMVEELDRILSLQPESIRIEALRAGEDEIHQLLNIYREAMEYIEMGRIAELKICKQKLAGVSFSPFTRGHYNRGVL
ncbi:MAG: U32 family peptidase, partial [Syntrophomonadaceae bacterium]|nr:U32 family peptidase [Syntrophomonadaceae bacterium]